MATQLSVMAQFYLPSPQPTPATPNLNKFPIDTGIPTTGIALPGVASGDLLIFWGDATGSTGYNQPTTGCTVAWVRPSGGAVQTVTGHSTDIWVCTNANGSSVTATPASGSAAISAVLDVPYAGGTPVVRGANGISSFTTTPVSSVSCGGSTCNNTTLANLSTYIQPGQVNLVVQGIIATSAAQSTSPFAGRYYRNSLDFGSGAVSKRLFMLANYDDGSPPVLGYSSAQTGASAGVVISMSGPSLAPKWTFKGAVGSSASHNNGLDSDPGIDNGFPLGTLYLSHITTGSSTNTVNEYSTDGGVTWTPLPSSPINNGFNPTCLTGGGTGFGYLSGKKVLDITSYSPACSTGTSNPEMTTQWNPTTMAWQHCQKVSPSPAPQPGYNCTAVTGGNNGRKALIAGDGVTTLIADNSGVQYSIDGGYSTAQSTVTSGTWRETMAMATAGPGLDYAATVSTPSSAESVLWFSSDNGHTWTGIPNPSVNAQGNNRNYAMAYAKNGPYAGYVGVQFQSGSAAGWYFWGPASLGLSGLWVGPFPSYMYYTGWNNYSKPQIQYSRDNKRMFTVFEPNNTCSAGETSSVVSPAYPMYSDDGGLHWMEAGYGLPMCDGTNGSSTSGTPSPAGAAALNAYTTGQGDGKFYVAVYGSSTTGSNAAQTNGVWATTTSQDMSTSIIKMGTNIGTKIRVGPGMVIR